MADINLARSYSLPIASARARVRKAAEELAAEHNFRNEWSGNTLRFERPGLHGEIHISDSEIRLQAHLSPLLSPMKGRLVARIEDKFERLFPESRTRASPGRPHAKSAPAGRH